jgi:hypothetical protein
MPHGICQAVRYAGCNSDPQAHQQDFDVNKGKWGIPTTDMLKDAKTLTLDKVKEYFSDILKFDKTNSTGCQDQHWLLKLICNSCSSDFCNIVNETFNKLPDLSTSS